MRRINGLVLAAGMCVLYASSVAAGAESVHVGIQTPAAKPQPQAGNAGERKEISVPDKVLKAYVGEYELTPERTLTITLEKGSLWGQPSGQDRRQLFAESETKFFLKDGDVQLTFQKDAKGAVTGLVMDQAGRQRDLKKVK